MGPLHGLAAGTARVGPDPVEDVLEREHTLGPEVAGDGVLAGRAAGMLALRTLPPHPLGDALAVVDMAADECLGLIDHVKADGACELVLHRVHQALDAGERRHEDTLLHRGPAASELHKRAAETSDEAS